MLASAASPPTAQPTPDPVLVGVCDFPGAYPFPPIGYGGPEGWLWGGPDGGRQGGAEVHLFGPHVRRELHAQVPLPANPGEKFHPRDRQTRERPRGRSTHLATASR